VGLSEGAAGAEERYARDRAYAINSTLFSFGELLGWLEAIRREASHPKP
jgi:hypothetical protein